MKSSIECLGCGNIVFLPLIASDVRRQQLERVEMLSTLLINGWVFGPPLCPDCKVIGDQCREKLQGEF